MKLLFPNIALSVVILIAISPITIRTEACTRIVYKGPNGIVITARSMDFSMDIPANLWQFPRGMQRDGKTGQNTVWVDLKKMDFSPKTGKVKKLPLNEQHVYAGEASDKFIESEPFVFQGI